MITREKKEHYTEVTIKCDTCTYMNQSVNFKTNKLSRQPDFDFRCLARKHHRWVFLSIDGRKIDMCRWCWGGGMFSRYWFIKFTLKNS